MIEFDEIKKTLKHHIFGCVGGMAICFMFSKDAIRFMEEENGLSFTTFLSFIVLVLGFVAISIFAGFGIAVIENFISNFKRKWVRIIWMIVFLILLAILVYIVVGIRYGNRQ
jgi:hypothetical protein